jgi:hypothetical protein
MAKHNLAVLLGLLCLLAAIWATGMANDVAQKRFRIEGSAGYLRGMYSMIEAEKRPFYKDFGPLLNEAFKCGRLRDETRNKMHIECLNHYEALFNNKSLKKKQYDFYMNACRPENQPENELSNYKDSSDYAKVMWTLVEIANVDGRCDERDQWELFLSANGGTTNKDFKNYMNYFGKKKLAKCAPKAVDFMSKMHENSTPNLDKFFKTLFQLPKADDRELHERLRNANLLEDKLDFASTLKLSNVIETVRNVTFVPANYEPNNGKDVMAFISRKCEMLVRLFKGMLDVILLSEDSVEESELDDKVKKWIEYDHVCWYLVKYQKKFIRHVDRLLGTQSTPRKVADLITCHDCRARS